MTNNTSQSSGASNLKLALITFGLPAITTIITNLITTYPQIATLHQQAGSLENKTSKLQKGSLGSLEQGQKLCSIVSPGYWRDSLIVPQTWTPENCEDFRNKMTAGYFQLGCVYSDTISIDINVQNNSESLGAPIRKPPDNRCGW